MDIVLKLRELRRLRGYSQKDVARLTGVGDKTISSFETSARIGSMKLSQLAKLLRLYGFTEEQFFSRKIEELFDPDAIKERSREEQLIAHLAEFPTAAGAALLERFELMLDTALTVSGPASQSIRLVGHRAARQSAA